MSDNTPATTNGAEGTAVIQNVVRAEAQMVAQYAAKLAGDERAQEFAARVSLMCKTEPKFIQAIEDAPDSFLSAMMACVHLDLMPNTPEQHAFVIPYNNRSANRMEVQFQVGYKGLKELAMRSGEIKTLNAELVFKGDEFDVELGSERRLVHRPNFDVDRTNYDLVTHAYATAKLKNDEITFFVMTRKELDKIQETVKSSQADSPWKKWPEQQALKTVLKRATKLLPSSSKDNRLALAAELDSRAEVSKLSLDENGEFRDKTIVVPEASEEDKQRIKDEAAAAAARRKAEAENEED